MGTDWLIEQGEVYTALLEDGVLLGFSRESRGQYDPVRGAYEDGETLVFAAPGLVRTPGSAGPGSSGAWQDQTLVQTGDEVLLIACGSYAPELEDRVDLDGETWVVKGIAAFRPGLVPLYCQLLIRKV